MIINPGASKALQQPRACSHCHPHDEVETPQDGLAPAREPQPQLMNVSPGVTAQYFGPRLTAQQAASLSNDLAHTAAAT